MSIRNAVKAAIKAGDAAISCARDVVALIASATVVGTAPWTSHGGEGWAAAIVAALVGIHAARHLGRRVATEIAPAARKSIRKRIGTVASAYKAVGKAFGGTRETHGREHET